MGKFVAAFMTGSLGLLSDALHALLDVGATIGADAQHLVDLAVMGAAGVPAIGAGSIASFLATRPTWARAQRWIMASILGGLAVRMATEVRR